MRTLPHTPLLIQNLILLPHDISFAMSWSSLSHAPRPPSSDLVFHFHSPPYEPQPPSSPHNSVDIDLEFLKLNLVMDLTTLTIHKGSSSVISLVSSPAFAKKITTCRRAGKGNLHLRGRESGKYLFLDSGELLHVPILDTSSSGALRACIPPAIGS